MNLHRKGTHHFRKRGEVDVLRCDEDEPLFLLGHDLEIELVAQHVQVESGVDLDQDRLARRQDGKALGLALCTSGAPVRRQRMWRGASDVLCAVRSAPRLAMVCGAGAPNPRNLARPRYRRSSGRCSNRWPGAMDYAPCPLVVCRRACSIASRNKSSPTILAPLQDGRLSRIASHLDDHCGRSAGEQINHYGPIQGGRDRHG